MKIFKLLLCIYILMLSCLPCGDIQECNDATELAISSTSQHKSHTHTTEACTPFCTCSCCAASTVFQFVSAAVETPKVVYAALKYQHYRFPSHRGISFSIWQPPKIA